MQVSADVPMAGVIAGYRDAIAASDAIVRELGDPETRVARPLDGQMVTLRWVIAHVTNETARHAGHADILREMTDGVTGR